MFEINLRLFSGGGAKSGLGSRGGDKDAIDSNAKTYRFTYIDKDGNEHIVDARAENEEEANELVQIKLRNEGVLKAKFTSRKELKKEQAKVAKNVIETADAVEDTKHGSTIDLSGSPLSYTKDQAGLDKKQMKTIKSIADRIKNNSKETLAVFDKDGNKIFEKEGTVDNVSAPKSVMQQAEYDIHNHARGSGMVGGTFSVSDEKGKGDIQSLVNNTNLKTSFASTKEGTYYISKNNDFKGKQFLSHMKSVESRIKENMSQKLKELDNLREKGKIRHEVYMHQYRKIHNKSMVDLHNEYLKNQSRFGYSYGLIKQKKE